MKIKIGQGYDVHQLAEERPFWLGGVKIADNFGALGHSDADVLIHAICDALLGAANLKDIGHHFSNTNDKYKGIDSKLLLAEVMKMIRSEGYQVSNIDSTIVLEVPKVNPHIDEMKKVLSNVTNIPIEDISIKATTSETIGFIGRREGVEAYAVVLLYK